MRALTAIGFNPAYIQWPRDAGQAPIVVRGSGSSGRRAACAGAEHAYHTLSIPTGARPANVLFAVAGEGVGLGAAGIENGRESFAVGVEKLNRGSRLDHGVRGLEQGVVLNRQGWFIAPPSQ
jgi:hypothetical protein